MDFSIVDFLELMGLLDAVHIRRKLYPFPGKRTPAQIHGTHIGALAEQFRWASTPERYEYWETVDELWADITTEINGVDLNGMD